jgi:AhpD family alkylhydroperoxidase
MSRFIKYIQTPKPRAASGLTAQVYAQLQRDLGAVVDPLRLHAPDPALLAGAWAILRETLVAGRVRRGLKEAVAAAVSELNRCPWCVDVHGLMVRADGLASRADPVLQPLSAWAAATRSPDAAPLQAPPFAVAEAPEFIGTAVTFHYLNRMVNVLLVETFMPRQQLARSLITAAAPRLLRPLARRSYPPGESLVLLPDAPLPDDLSWAADAPTVAGAFARFTAVVEQASAQTIAPEVRALVTEYLASWHGEDPGLGRSWVERLVGALAEAQRPAARLALLAAVASYQVDDATVEAFRRLHPGDDALVGVLAWASFTAARRIGTWLALPPARPQAPAEPLAVLGGRPAV